ncbi:MAG: chromate transporter [Fusobacterium sp. JB021]|nr:chromate transporter [Fusobacterium sp. JB020]MDP0493476.1 chromate transporter [Fusobacterium sp. JB021]MDP0506346.1 chromate transporter [Fusobacterium sp. JB019]
MTKNKHLYFKLFLSTFYLSAFTFGGGYVIVPLMKKKFVDDLGWVEEKEMLDLIAIGQSSPGAIAVNTSILIGYRVAGLRGAFVTISGTVLPPLIIITIVSMFYSAFRDNKVVNAILKGMQAGVAVVIFDVVSTMTLTILKSKKIFMIILMIIAFLAAYYFRVNVALIIIIAMIIGVIRK